MKQGLPVAVTGLLIMPLAACGQNTPGGEVAPPASTSSSAPTSASPSSPPVSPDDDYEALAKTVLADVGNGWKKQGEVSDDTPSHRKDQTP